MSRTSTILMALGLLSTAIAAALFPFQRFAQLDLVLLALGLVLAFVSVFSKPQAATVFRFGPLLFAALGLLLVTCAAFALVTIADMVVHPASGIFQYGVTPAKVAGGVAYATTAALSFAGGLARGFRLSRTQFATWLTAALAVPLAALSLFLAM